MPNRLTDNHPNNVKIIKKHLEVGDILYHAGKKQCNIYAISSGSFKISYISSNGHEQITGFYLPGDVIGLDGLGGNTTKSTATALETSTICSISEHEFNQLCNTNHILSRSFMRVISKNISRDQQHFIKLAQRSARARLAGFIVESSYRYKNTNANSKEFLLTMQRCDIANYLGITSSTVSRLLKKFQYAGYLTIHRRRVKILNWDSLCKESNLARATLEKQAM